MSQQSRGKAGAVSPISSYEGINPRSDDVEIGKLLEPKLAARQTFDEQKLQELIQSVTVMGILQSLVVEEEGDMFRIHAGHRRFIAAGAVGLAKVPCRIWKAGTLKGQAAKAHENAFREDLNPAEEAVYLQALFDTDCNGDVDQVCEMTKLNRPHVEGRLILLNGDPDVFEAMRTGAIKLGVAQELNKVKDLAQRRMYLLAAAQGGATERTVRGWRTNGELLMACAPVELPPVDTTGPPQAEAYDSPMKCFLCGQSDQTHTMQFLWVHWGCNRALLEPLLKRMGIESAEEPGT